MADDAIITVVGAQRERTRELSETLGESVDVVKVLAGAGLITVKIDAGDLKRLCELDWVASADTYDPEAPRKFRFTIRPKKPRRKPAKGKAGKKKPAAAKKKTTKK